MTATVGVITFPGSLDDRDALRAVRMMGAEATPLWHADTDIAGVDAIILPGGFSYGDYLRTGAIARFAPIMGSVRAFAEGGGPVLGICNGFQILCEAGLLPGALIRNRGLSFVCRWINVRPEGSSEVLAMPIKHGEGQFVASAADVASIEAEGLVALRYCSPQGVVEEAFNPNGSRGNVAGIRNAVGNVLGLMPHPEHAVDPDLGPTGGHHVFEWLLSAATARASAGAPA